MAKGQIKISGISLPKRGRKIKDIVAKGGGCGCGVAPVAQTGGGCGCGSRLPPPMTGGYVSIDALQQGGQIPSWLSSAINKSIQVGQDAQAVEPPSVLEDFAKEGGAQSIEDAEDLPTMDISDAVTPAPLEELEPPMSGGETEFEEMVPDAVVASQPNKIVTEQAGGKPKKRIPKGVLKILQEFKEKGGVIPPEKKKIRAVSLKAQRAGYKATKRDLEYLRKWKRGESIGFTMVASLKAKGLIPRESKTMKGKRVVSNKYKK